MGFNRSVCPHEKPNMDGTLKNTNAAAAYGLQLRAKRTKRRVRWGHPST